MIILYLTLQIILHASNKLWLNEHRRVVVLILNLNCGWHLIESYRPIWNGNESCEIKIDHDTRGFTKDVKMTSNLSELHEKTHFKSIGKNSEICALFLLRLGCWKLSVVYKSRVIESSVTSCELLAIFSRSTWSRWAKDWGNLVWNQIIYLNQDSHWNSLASEQLYISRIKRIFFCMLEPTTIP